jgi:hypothetical protein
MQPGCVLLDLSADTATAAAFAAQYLAAGGLLSLLKPNTPDIFIFDVSDADKPVYKYGLTSTIGTCPDEFVAARSGGFYASSMCSRTGESGSHCSVQAALTTLRSPNRQLACQHSVCVLCDRHT